MFTTSSHLYDLIYSFKDYEKEANGIIKIVRDKHPECETILDIGCGTSEHHKYLNLHFKVDGIDLNEQFIQISQQKNKNGHYAVADMVQFDLGKQYDVITCLFSSIGYLRSVEEITSTLKCFRKHLKSSGLVLVEPWFTKENWQPGKMNMLAVDKETFKVCRISKSELSGDFSILNFHYLIGNTENGVQYLKEEHKLRLTSREEMLSAFKLAGFEATFDEQGLTGRGMYYAEKNDL